MSMKNLLSTYLGKMEFFISLENFASFYLSLVKSVVVGTGEINEIDMEILSTDLNRSSFFPFTAKHENVKN